MDIEIAGFSDAIAGGADFVARIGPQLVSKALLQYGLKTLVTWALALGFALNYRAIREKIISVFGDRDIALVFFLSGLLFVILCIFTLSATFSFFDVLIWPDLYVAEQITQMLKTPTR